MTHVDPMNIKAQAIKSYLENIEADLKGKYETIHDQFVVDLLLEQHHKAKHMTLPALKIL